MNIPGYYYDPEKKRYFKVENSKTAPTNAAWSSNNVKRRKLRDEDAATTLRHLNIARDRVRRARVLHEPLTGGFFAREYGAARDDMPAACLVDGLRNKGYFEVKREGETAGQVRRMCVTGADYKTDMCAVYAAPNEDHLASTYVPRDGNKRINQRLLANYRLRYPVLPPYMESPIPQVSDIKHHTGENFMLVTSTQPYFNNTYNALWVLFPDTDDVDGNPRRPRWTLPSTRGWTVKIDGVNDIEAHCVAPGIVNSPLTCLVGTSRGIVRWDGKGYHAFWVTPPRRPRASLCDVFAIDRHPTQAYGFQFGGRPGVLFTADIREEHTSWLHAKLPSTITHLKYLDGGNHVLAAGLQNQLGVYDLRFMRTRRSRDDSDKVDTGTRNGKKRGTYHKNRPEDPIAQPVIKFEQYRNSAHTDIGFAYDADTGIVAAAHDDVPGTVALYSVRTGSRLRVLDFATEGKPSGRPRSILDTEPERVDLPIIKGMQFYTFPGDHTPTLFVGSDRKSGITAFSFGVDDLEDEA